MLRTIQDFIASWQYESNCTHTMFLSIPDSVMDTKLGNDVRSIKRLAWHITQTIPEMMGSAGVPLQGISADAPLPDTMADITAAYKAASDALAQELPKVWKDENLTEEQTMYGEQWKKGFTLFCLIQHQTHHRGQLTVLMRLAGLTVPGVYGPAKEEWAAMGMQAME